MRSFSVCNTCVVLLALVSATAAAPINARVPVSAVRASRPAGRYAPVVQPRASEETSSLPQSRARALPPGGETAPGSLDPIPIPFRSTSTFHPMYAGTYGEPGPFATQVSGKSFDLGLTDQQNFGFSQVVAAFPYDFDNGDTDPTTKYPVIAWGVGAHNGCTHIDNLETLTHLASWGFVVLCPEVFPEPFPGDEFVLFATLRFALDRNADENSKLFLKLKTDAIGVAGYSLGGGRVVRGISTLAQIDIAQVLEDLDDEITQVLEDLEDEVTSVLDPRNVDVDSRATVATSKRSASTTRALLDESTPLTCDDVACVAQNVGAAVSLQGWYEGPGLTSFKTPLLLLGSDDDLVVGDWRDGSANVFDSAAGPKLQGVVKGGGHNLGPHYWFGMQVAFLRAELLGDADARLAVWGDENQMPFGEHPNLLYTRRAVDGTNVETFDFQEDEEQCAALIQNLSC